MHGRVHAGPVGRGREVEERGGRGRRGRGEPGGRGVGSQGRPSIPTIERCPVVLVRRRN